MAGSCRWLLMFLIFTELFACTSRKDGRNEIQKDSHQELSSGDVEKGKALYATCKTCHGESGQGNPKLNAPSLANIDGWYLYRQLMHFKKGIRGYLPADTLGLQMAAMANTLKDSVTVRNVVAYIETLPEASVEITFTADIKKGQRTYESICGSCHGPRGKGNEAMNAPRLNGLDDWYLKRQLINFKTSIRGSHPRDSYGQQMVPMATLLRDDDAIDDVIAYIQSVQPVAR